MLQQVKAPGMIRQYHRDSDEQDRQNLRTEQVGIAVIRSFIDPTIFFLTGYRPDYMLLFKLERL